MEKHINEIICGDNVEVLQGFPDGCIDLTVTSPPYDNLRTYNGFEWDFESLAQELYRVTKNGGVAVWVVNDATVNGSETGTSFRQALYFKEIGFNLHDTMIYAKNNPVPLSHNRYEQQFEYMFILSKGKPDVFNGIKEDSKYAGEKRHREYKSREYSTESVRSRDEWTIVQNKRLRRNIWYYSIGNGVVTRDRLAYKHPAIFPEKLAEDHIVSWSNPGDIVLDPFIGSGTTAKMAALNGRKYIGIDISEEYCEIARRRVSGASV